MKPKPWHDCPKCKYCGDPVVTPIRPTGQTVNTTDRWYGPRDATLWCPACGEGWRHELPEEFVRADRAWHAWERKQDRDERDAKQRQRAEDEKRRLAEYERTWGKP